MNPNAIAQVRGSYILAWDPALKVNIDAFTLICLRVAEALSPTRRGIPLYPETEDERAFVANFREEYSIEQREAALESTLNHFVGGTLQGAIKAIKPQRRRDPLWRTRYTIEADGRVVIGGRPDA